MSQNIPATDKNRELIEMLDEMRREIHSLLELRAENADKIAKARVEYEAQMVVLRARLASTANMAEIRREIHRSRGRRHKTSRFTGYSEPGRELLLDETTGIVFDMASKPPVMFGEIIDGVFVIGNTAN